ncbi:MAG: hypothetical protein JOZ03_03690 [Gammaproteobacteria bacterium]|nr:hypothetical protein [Gammaproteobacteria bacterium]
MRLWRVLWGAVALALSAPALAVGALADVTIVDRDTGATLPVIYHHGEYWVAGTPSARYAIRIGNRSGGRLLAVTAVDGINVITGASAAFGQGGYVFEPGESYEISGWRKSDREVAAFTFTALADAYASRTGRPENVGVVGVALFRERAPAAVIAPGAEGFPRAPMAADAARESNAAMAGQGAERLAGAAAAVAPRLGTGHGTRESSYVTETLFERQQEHPSEVIRIRYDSLENLIALGVVHRPRPTPARPEAFPGSNAADRYVPDPPG